MSDYDFIEKNVLNLEDRFSFSCNCCGDCCKNRDDILVNPYDIFRLSKGLNISDSQLLQMYCEVYIGSTSKIPLVRICFPGGVCSFLKNDKCSVHSFKPSVCKLYPLGRGMVGESGDVFYFKQDVSCGGKDTQLVKDWVKDLDEKVFIKWSTSFFKLMTDKNYKLLVEKFTSCEEEVYKMFFYSVFDILYLHYDTRFDFLPQLDEHFEKVFSMLHSSDIERLIYKF